MYGVYAPKNWFFETCGAKEVPGNWGENKSAAIFGTRPCSLLNFHPT